MPPNFESSHIRRAAQSPKPRPESLRSPGSTSPEPRRGSRTTWTPSRGPQGPGAALQGPSMRTPRISPPAGPALDALPPTLFFFAVPHKARGNRASARLARTSGGSWFSPRRYVRHRNELPPPGGHSASKPGSRASFSPLNIRLLHAPARRPSAPARTANFSITIVLELRPSAHAKGRILDGGRAYRMARRRFRAAITLTWSQQGSKTQHLPPSSCGRREAPTPAPERHARATRPP